MVAGSPTDWLASIPLGFLAVAGVVGFVVALIAVLAVVDPRTRRQLHFVARQTGIGWETALVLVIVITATVGSVFALGGTTTGRYDYPLVFALLVHCTGLFLLGDAAGTLPRYLGVRRATRLDAADVEPGERIAVDGAAVVAQETLETPFGRESALCYEIRVMERRGDSDLAVNAEQFGVGGNWQPEYVDERSVAFRVDDGTASVPVVPDGATLDLEETAAVTVPLEGDHPDRITDFVTDNLVEVGFGGHDRRYVEAALRPGNTATVVGPVVESESVAGAPPVVDAREGDCIVASRGIGAYQSKLHRRVAGAVVGGLALATMGYASMLAVSGAA